MARPKKQFRTKAEREKHEERLHRRREAHHEKKTIEMASRAAEGETDFAALVEAEKHRLAEYDVEQAKRRAGAAQSPKITVRARESLAKAFDLMGGVPALVVWGRANPTEFYRLWAKLVPPASAMEAPALPLEDLLSKLADRESMSVMDAAREIGEETLNEARKRIEAEDALASPGPDDSIN